MTARARAWARRGLHVLLLILFVAVQTTALAHEVQHVLHQHDGPCALHVVADHLVMAAAPEAVAAVAPAPAADLAGPSSRTPPSLAAPPSGARASPVLS